MKTTNEASQAESVAAPMTGVGTRQDDLLIPSRAWTSPRLDIIKEGPIRQNIEIEIRSMATPSRALSHQLRQNMESFMAALACTLPTFTEPVWDKTSSQHSYSLLLC